MASVKLSLFSKNRSLEAEIDDFLDTVSQGGMLFEETLRHYARSGMDVRFTSQQEQLNDIESDADALVRNIVRSLYSDMLIPESRADVLGLLQDIDALLGVYEHICDSVAIEQPQFTDLPERFDDMFDELIRLVVQTVEALISAARSFFRDIHVVRDHLHKVRFLEGEADKVSAGLKYVVFQSELPLDRKMHLRYFIDKLDSIADEAEDAADRLAIFTVKRSL